MIKSVCYDPFTNETQIQHENGSLEWIDSRYYKEYANGNHELFEQLRKKLRLQLITLQDISQILYDLGVAKYLWSRARVFKELSLDINDIQYIPKGIFYTVENDGKDLVKHDPTKNSLRLTFKSYDNLLKYCYENKIMLTIANYVMSETEAKEQYGSSLVDLAVNA